MFIPARRARGPAAVCERMPRLLSFATIGAVSMGAAFGVVPAASADPQPDQRVSVAVDIIGDSYMAGEGIRDTYINPSDPRHRSVVAPALQALSRLGDTTRLRVDANIVAASGARTADFFTTQQGPDNIVNPAQRDQLRPDTQLVIVGFGGEDAHLAAVLAAAKRTANGPNTALDKQLKELGPLLDATASDEEYLAQAKSAPLGQAPTLVARMLQVLAGIKARAPHATILVTNYPLAADPDNGHAASIVGADELTAVRKFNYDLNKAIERAVQLCRCGSLVDLSEALAGHEAYTGDSAFNEQPDQQAPRERFQPNQKGASLIANPIAVGIASLLRITPPKPSDGQLTVPKNIDIRTGVSDRDGDRVPDNRDRAPDDPTRSQDAPRPKHAPAARESSVQRAKPSHGRPHPVSGVTRTVARVVDSVAPAHNRARPNGQARPNEQRAPVTSPAPPVNAHAPAEADRRPAEADRPVASVRQLLTRNEPKKSRPDGTAPIELTPPAVAPKREDRTTAPPAYRRITGTETSERKPNPADAGPKLTAGRKSPLTTTPGLSEQTQNETARFVGWFARPAATESSEPEGMVP